MPDKPPAGYWSWREKGQAAYKKQLAPKKNAPKGAFFKDNPSSKESLAKE